MRIEISVVAVLALAGHASAGDEWFVQNVSADGKHALEHEMQDNGAQHFRVIEVDTNKVEADLELDALSALPLETMLDGGGLKPIKLDLSKPELAADLKHAAAALAPFPFGAGGRIAASPDGKHVVFNGGDWLFAGENGHVGGRLSNEASYGPLFTPDGKSLLFRREKGTYDGVEGRYELYVTSADGRLPPKELAGTAGVFETMAPSDHGTLRVMVSSEPFVKTCVLDVGLVAPFKVQKVACLPGDEKEIGCVLSPHGTWLACTTSRELKPHDLAFRTRTLDLATGKVVLDLPDAGVPSAISDDGLLVLSHLAFSLVDPSGKRRELRANDRIGLYTYFRSATELITELDGRLSVIDVSK